MKLAVCSRRPGRGSAAATVGGTFLATLAIVAGAAAPVQAAPRGVLDASFGHAGTATTPTGVTLSAAVTQPDGRVLAMGADSRHGGPVLALARFSTSGVLDRSFGSGGVVDAARLPGESQGSTSGRAVAIQPDGKIVVVGTALNGDSTGMLVDRFNTNGTPDRRFGSGGHVELLAGTVSGTGEALAIQPDGKIIATGYAYASGSGNGSYPRAALVRLNANGSLDRSFGSAGTDVIDLGPYSSAAGVALQGDGKIVIVGSQSPNLQSVNALIARLTPQGSLDPSFAGTGASAAQYAQGGAASSMFNSVAVQPDGKIVAAGEAGAAGSQANALIARFTSTGAGDGSFGSRGVVYALAARNYLGTGTVLPGAAALALAPNHDVVIAGTFVNQVLTYGALWAFTANGAPDPSFGTHGSTLIKAQIGQNAAESALSIAPDGSLITAGALTRVGSSQASGAVSRLGGYPLGSLQQPSRSYKTRSLAAHGLTLTVSCNRSCRVHEVLSLSASQARRIRLKTRGQRPVTLGSVSVSLTGSSRRRITLRLDRALITALARQKRLSATLQVTLSPVPSGPGVALSRSIILTG